ncbi:MAG: lipid asymmetry maintenance protein MlaB [Actinomycetes bacterium]
MNQPVVLDLHGAVEPADVPALCRRLLRLLDDGGARAVVCDLAGLSRTDAVTVEALARLQLTAKRRGGSLLLRGVSPQLTRLLALAGLTAVLPAEPSALGVRGEAEEGEQVRVEEVRDADDPPVGHA